MRVQIDLPDRFLFRTEIPIRIDDINYGNHLANDAVLAIAQEARLRFLKTQGWTELDVDGVGLTMVDAAVVYRAQGTHGMVLAVELAAAAAGSRGYDLVYRMTDVASGREIARVKTGLLFFDYAKQRVAHVPEKFRAALAAMAAAAGA